MTGGGSFFHLFDRLYLDRSNLRLCIALGEYNYEATVALFLSVKIVL